MKFTVIHEMDVENVWCDSTKEEVKAEWGGYEKEEFIELVEEGSELEYSKLRFKLEMIEDEDLDPEDLEEDRYVGDLYAIATFTFDIDPEDEEWWIDFVEELHDEAQTNQGYGRDIWKVGK